MVGFKIDKNTLLEKKKDYYSKTFIQLEIVKCLYKRELAVLTKNDDEDRLKIRYLIAYTVEYLLKHFDRIEFDKYLANLYMSNAILSEIPVFSYNFKVRRLEDKYKEFRDNFSNYVVGYDLFIDFDGKEDFNKCYQESKEFKKILEDYKVPYYLLNSSSNGFHFKIPFEYLSFFPVLELIEQLKTVVDNIIGIHEFTTLDDSIVDIKRICKIPYSFVVDGTIALPLTDEQFNNFNPEMVFVDNVLKNVSIKNRGLLLRNYELDNKTLKENTKKFIFDYI